jgi:hypothetical protein
MSAIKTFIAEALQEGADAAEALAYLDSGLLWQEAIELATPARMPAFSTPDSHENHFSA